MGNLLRFASRQPGHGNPTQAGGLRFPNEPVGAQMIWSFDPGHPDGLNQAGSVVVEPDGLSIVDAPWSPRGGKALETNMFAGPRQYITGLAAGTGPYAGWTIVTSPGYGAAYNASRYKAPAGNDGGQAIMGVPSSGFVVAGLYCGNFLRMWTPALQPSGGAPVVIDNDTVAVPYAFSNFTSSYVGGTGLIGFESGIGTASIQPNSGAYMPVCSLFNTYLYHAALAFIPVGSPGHLVAGPKQFFYSGPSFGHSGMYGPLGGLAALSTSIDDELTRSLAVAWAWSADNGVGGTVNHSIIGGGYTDGHLSYDWDNPSRPDYVMRGTPIFYEILVTAGAEGDLTGSSVKMWINATSRRAPDYIRTGFDFSDGNYGWGGFGMRGFNPNELTNTDGGGGVIAPYDKKVQFGFFKVSGGYARAGEQPSHYDVSLSDPGGALPRVVRATFTLKDANNNRIRCPVPTHAVGAFGNSVADLQFDVSNGGSWPGNYVTGSWSEGFTVTGEVLHGSTVPGASYPTAYTGPMVGAYAVRFGTYSVTLTAQINPGDTSMVISPAAASMPSGTILGAGFAASGGRVTLAANVNPGDTTIAIVAATATIASGTTLLGAIGVEGVDYSVTQPSSAVNTPTVATVNILPGTLLTGAVTIDYYPLGENFLRAGQVAIDATITTPGDTVIAVQQFPRANNDQRVGSPITGSATVSV